MNQKQAVQTEQKKEIINQIAELSRLLAMIPSDDTIEINTPMVENKMILSDWFSGARRSFLKLSLLISKELDIDLQ